MRVYISGKMTGLEKEEYRAKFNAAADRLVEQGYTVVNPALLDEFGLTYAEYMAVDTTLLSFCDAIYMLDNWKDSGGAHLEWDYANTLGLVIIYEEEEQK